jgi:hypothetical protein
MNELMQPQVVQPDDGDVMLNDSPRNNSQRNASERAGVLREQLLGVLGLALRSADGRGGAPDPELRRAIQRSGESARESGLRAEQLIILLKEAWHELPEARRAPHRGADDVLARVITLCIDQYYQP